MSAARYLASHLAPSMGRGQKASARHRAWQRARRWARHRAWRRRARRLAWRLTFTTCGGTPSCSNRLHGLVRTPKKPGCWPTPCAPGSPHARPAAGLHGLCKWCDVRSWKNAQDFRSNRPVDLVPVTQEATFTIANESQCSGNAIGFGHGYAHVTMASSPFLSMS